MEEMTYSDILTGELADEILDKLLNVLYPELVGSPNEYKLKSVLRKEYLNLDEEVCMDSVLCELYERLDNMDVIALVYSVLQNGWYTDALLQIYADRNT